MAPEPIQIFENPELEKSLERLRQKILPPFENFSKEFCAHKKFQPNGKRSWPKSSAKFGTI